MAWHPLHPFRLSAVPSNSCLVPPVVLAFVGVDLIVFLINDGAGAHRPDEGHRNGTETEGVGCAVGSWAH